MIILFTFWNCLFVPYEIAYDIQGSVLVIIIDRLIDIAFIMDIFISFRTMYLDNTGRKMVKDSK